MANEGSVHVTTSKSRSYGRPLVVCFAIVSITFIACTNKESIYVGDVRSESGGSSRIFNLTEHIVTADCQTSNLDALCFLWQSIFYNTFVIRQLYQNVQVTSIESSVLESRSQRH